jgi:hypothetical protein
MREAFGQWLLRLPIFLSRISDGKFYIAEKMENLNPESIQANC